jgi:Leucine-rich repeat (LRR) protein
MDSNRDLSQSLLGAQADSTELHSFLGQTANPLISIDDDNTRDKEIIEEFSNKVRDGSAQVKYIRFLTHFAILEHDLQQANLQPQDVQQLFKMQYAGYLLRLLALRSIIQKGLMWPLLSESEIRRHHLKHFFSRPRRHVASNRLQRALLACQYHSVKAVSTRVWPQEQSIMVNKFNGLRKVYGVEGFMQGTGFLVNRVWSALLLSFLLHDVIVYYQHPTQRYDTSLAKIFFSQTENQRSLSTSLTSVTVWPELLLAPFLWGCFKMFKGIYQAKELTDSKINEFNNTLQQHQNTFWQNGVRWLMPLHQTQKTLNQISRAIRWDGRLTNEQRLSLHTALLNFEKSSTLWAQLEVMSTLADIVADLGFKDIRNMYGDNLDEVDKQELMGVLTIKTQALKRLHALASQYYAPNQSYQWYTKVKPLPRYLWAHYLLWCLGQPQSKILQPLFWAVKSVKVYAQIRLLYLLITGINIIVQRYLDKKACESKGRLWMYVERAADYMCTVCGDLNVFYKNMFDDQGCLTDYTRFPRTAEQYIKLLHRVKFDKIQNITVYLDKLNPFVLNDVLTSLKQRAPQLERLDLGYYYSKDINPYWQFNRTAALAIKRYLTNSHLLELELAQIANKTLDGAIEVLAKEMQVFNALSYLGLSSNGITNKGLASLEKILSNSFLLVLNLSGNQISNLMPLAKILQDSQLVKLDLSTNKINEIPWEFIQALSSSRLKELYFYENTISDLTNLTKGLPHSSLDALSLSDNRISNVTALARSLSNSNLTWLDLSFNSINNLSEISQALTNSFLKILYLAANPITDLSPLTKALPYSHLRELDLGVLGSLNNSSLSALYQALPGSSLQALYLGYNGITNVSGLAQVLPSTKLQALSLSNNEISDLSALSQAMSSSQLSLLRLNNNPIGNKALTALAQELPNSSLETLDLSSTRASDVTAIAQVLSDTLLQDLNLNDNEIRDLSAFEHFLPSPNLQRLHLGWNRITSLAPLAKILPHSNLTFLYLNNNQIQDLAVFIQALPKSKLKDLYLSDNKLDDMDAQTFAKILVKLPSSVPTLWVSSLDPDQKRAINEAQPNTKIETLDLSYNHIKTSGAIALCRIFSNTDIISIANSYFIIPYWEWISPTLFNNSIDNNIVDIYTCKISAAASSRTIPWPLKISFQFFSAITQYPLDWLRSFQKTLTAKQNARHNNNVKPEKKGRYSKLNLQSSLWKLPIETALPLPTVYQYHITYTSLALQMQILASPISTTVNTTFNNYPLFNSHATLPNLQNNPLLANSIDIISSGQLSMILLLTLLGTLFRSFLPKQPLGTSNKQDTTFQERETGAFSLGLT